MSQERESISDDHCLACAAACHPIHTGGGAYSGSCCKSGKRLCMLASLHVLMLDLLRAILEGQLLSWQEYTVT